MTNNIYITYDCSGAAAYSFWKQFFMMCRAWVSGHKIDHMEEDVPDITEAESLHLYFLSNDQLLAIKQNALKEHVFYFVNERNYYHGKSCQFRRDILVYDWKKRDTFLKALNQMAGGENENYSRLIEIYMDNSLWMSAWLYHELACDEKTEWDAWIVKNSKAALESLDMCIEENKAKDIWHYEFMHLYCGYLIAAVESRHPEEREEKARMLLQEAELLSRKTGWQPALCELFAAISCLSPLENKYSFAYYKAILKYEKNPETLYKIGWGYEKIFGDIEMAKRYYELANESGRCYKARFKIASYHEINGDWEKALFLYESVMEQLKEKFNGIPYQGVTVCHAKYYLKALVRIRNIFWQNNL